MIFYGQVKQKASKGLKNNWVKVLLTVFLFGILTIGADIAVSIITYPTQEYIQTELMNILEAAIQTQNRELIIEAMIEIVYATGSIYLWNTISIAATILSMLFSLSLVKVYICASKGEKYGFKKFDLSLRTIRKSFCLELLKTLIVFLWSLLFIVPGIIKLIAYSQASYIQLENPDKKTLDCLKESEKMMYGRKAEYFSYKLSFIGWIILASVAISAIDVMILSYLINSAPIVWIIVSVILGYILQLPIYVYMGVSDAVYYEELKEDIKKPKTPFMFFVPPQGFNNPNQNGQNTSGPNFGGQPFEDFTKEREREDKDPFSDF